LLSFPIGKAIIKNPDCKAVVVGGPTVPCRGLLYAADKLETDAYLVPHGITRPREPLAPSSTMMFVPGRFGKAYLEGVFPDDRLPDIIATGRPYLESQYGERREQYDPPKAGDPIRIVLATQDFSDRVRETFVQETLVGIEQMGHTVEVIIKTHPSESTALYEEILGRKPSRSNTSVRIEETGLQRHMREADLLITVNSNVGLEAVILGTPSVSINLFKPYVPAYPYVQAGAVPELTSREDIESFLEEIDAETLQSLRERQEEFLQNNYSLGGGSPKRIADRIEDSIN